MFRSSSLVSQRAKYILKLLEHLINILLAEFSVRSVNYGPSVFPSIYGPSASRLGHKSMEKKRGSVIYTTDRKNEANKMFIIWLLPVLGDRKQVQDARFDSQLTGVK